MKLTNTCCQGWEDEANHPAEDIHESYEVVFAPMVFVRKAGKAVQSGSKIYHIWCRSYNSIQRSPQFRFPLTFLWSLPLCCFLVSSPGSKYRHWTSRGSKAWRSGAVYGSKLWWLGGTSSRLVVFFLFVVLGYFDDQTSRNASGGWMLVDGARGGKQSLGDGIEICSEDFLRWDRRCFGCVYGFREGHGFSCFVPLRCQGMLLQGYFWSL